MRWVMLVWPLRLFVECMTACEDDCVRTTMTR